MEALHVAIACLPHGKPPPGVDLTFVFDPFMGLGYLSLGAPEASLQNTVHCMSKFL